MRLDKYLKNARIIKRRTVANEACDQGRVMVNDKVAKAGTTLKVGDIVEIQFGDKPIKIKVAKLLEHVKKEEAQEMYEQL